MKFHLSVGPLLTCIAMLLASVNSYANSYNDGLLAAESGDYQKAAAQWKPLAGRDNAEAQFNLGLLYHSGSGVEQDEQKAVALYHKAANNGYSYAQEYLAVGYQEGWFGLPKDAAKADYWHKQLETNQ